MTNFGRPVKQISSEYFESNFQSIVGSGEPVIVKSVASNWPLVKSGVASDSKQSAISYLDRQYNGAPIGLLHGTGIDGRLFYDEEMKGFNFSFTRQSLRNVFDKIISLAGENETYYVGSTTVQECFPELLRENDIALNHPSSASPIVSIWMCNEARVACHFDGPDNLAVCAVGARRFTLFPPNEIANLYPGPFDLTPAGQVISLVDFKSPDLDAHPNFTHAMKSALVADLKAGDALYLPSMWWHQVDSQSEFNVLVNYWWSSSSQYMGSAKAALKHAILSIRGLPDKEREAWGDIFDYYVFGGNDKAVKHLPESVWGSLDTSDDLSLRRLKRDVINSLNR